jgi:hypothetical protein
MPLKSVEVFADKSGMGRLVYFPNLDGDAQDSDNLLAYDRGPAVEAGAASGLLDPSEWGISRTFFLVGPVLDEPLSDESSVS